MHLYILVHISVKKFCLFENLNNNVQCKDLISSTRHFISLQIWNIL
jgi:hypothetical protein